MAFGFGKKNEGTKGILVEYSLEPANNVGNGYEAQKHQRGGNYQRKVFQVPASVHKTIDSEGLRDIVAKATGVHRDKITAMLIDRNP